MPNSIFSGIRGSSNTRLYAQLDDSIDSRDEDVTSLLKTNLNDKLKKKLDKLEKEIDKLDKHINDYKAITSDWLICKADLSMQSFIYNKVDYTTKINDLINKLNADKYYTSSEERETAKCQLDILKQKFTDLSSKGNLYEVYYSASLTLKENMNKITWDSFINRVHENIVNCDEPGKINMLSYYEIKVCLINYAIEQCNDQFTNPVNTVEQITSNILEKIANKWNLENIDDNIEIQSIIKQEISRIDLIQYNTTASSPYVVGPDAATCYNLVTFS